MQSFWNEEGGYMAETNVTSGVRSGIGAAPLMVSVLNFDPTLGCDSATFQPCSDRALSSLMAVGDAFTKIFPINEQLPPDQSPYFGSFLEDQLYGGQVSSILSTRSTITVGTVSAESLVLGAILCHFQRRRADIRRTHDVGPCWPPLCQQGQCQVLPAI